MLHLTSGSDAGGISRYLHVLCGELVRKGHKPVIAGEVGAWHELFETVSWPWVEAPLKAGPIGLWRAQHTIARGLRSAGFDDRPPIDVIHAHYRRSSLVGRWLAKRWKVPLLYTLHLTGIPLSRTANMLSDWGDRTHVPSSQARDWLLEETSIDEDRIELIPHGIDTQHYQQAGEPERQAARATLKLGDHTPVVGFVGRFDDPKNEAWVIDLADLSREIAPHAIFVMQGEGPREEEVRRAIRNRGLTERVLVREYGDPTPVYRAADLVVIPSFLEGFSYVTTEAMAIGCAVLRTRTAGWEEHIIEGQTGQSCKIEREAFLMAGLEMLGDPDGLRAIGQRAAAHVREHLTLPRQIEDTIRLYRSMIEAQRH